MTDKQLNSAIRKFASEIKEGKIEPYTPEAKAEFTRLHGADNSFKALSADSLRIMIVLNRKYTFIPVKDFGPYDY